MPVTSPNKTCFRCYITFLVNARCLYNFERKFPTNEPSQMFAFIYICIVHVQYLVYTVGIYKRPAHKYDQGPYIRD
jgi:hypothetical protein